nr:hypothetical protein [Tanacetum cinerariifolium]
MVSGIRVSIVTQRRIVLPGDRRGHLFSGHGRNILAELENLEVRNKMVFINQMNNTVLLVPFDDNGIALRLENVPRMPLDQERMFVKTHCDQEHDNEELCFYAPILAYVTERKRLIANFVGPTCDPWDQRVRSQLIGKDLASGLLVYELPLSITMTKIIKGEFKKLESLNISDVFPTYNTSFEIFNEEFNRMSRMDGDLFTYEVEIAVVTNIPYVPWVHEKPWTDDGAWKEPALVEHYCEPFNYKNRCSECPTCSWRDDGYCNGGNLPGAYIVENALCYQDFEWYEALQDGKLKEEALKNKAITERIIKDGDNESSNKDKERCELFNDHERPVCTIRRFEMIKYSFRLDEEYVAVKENEYDDLTITREDACRTYQEIFHMMDEGCMDTRDRILHVFLIFAQDLVGKEIDEVGEVSIIWNHVCVVVMLVSRRIYNTHSCS